MLLLLCLSAVALSKASLAAESRAADIVKMFKSHLLLMEALQQLSVQLARGSLTKLAASLGSETERMPAANGFLC